jgi:hypothetical protein
LATSNLGCSVKHSGCLDAGLAECSDGKCRATGQSDNLALSLQDRRLSDQMQRERNRALFDGQLFGIDRHATSQSQLLDFYRYRPERDQLYWIRSRSDGLHHSGRNVAVLSRSRTTQQGIRPAAMSLPSFWRLGTRSRSAALLERNSAKF